MARFFRGYERRRSVKSVNRLLQRYRRSVGKTDVRVVKRVLRQLLRKLDGVNPTFSHFTRLKYRVELQRMEGKGRWKTRGGRDQDRWRAHQGNKERSRRKCRDVCRSNDFDWILRNLPTSEQVESCFVKSMYGTLELKDNPDCGFVKGGES